MHGALAGSPHAARSRIHLACTPMADPDEAAAIVNAPSATRRWWSEEHCRGLPG